MIEIYIDLIKSGVMSIDQVPLKFREEILKIIGSVL